MSKKKVTEEKEEKKFRDENVATEERDEQQSSENGNAAEDVLEPEEIRSAEDVTEEEMVPVEKFESLEEEYNKLYDKYLRQVAEFENYKKRMNRDLTRRVEFANEELLREVLPIMDDLERSVQATEDKSAEEHLQEGLQLVYNNFKNVLKRRGVEPIQSVGEPFDPELHEAVMMQESDEYDSDIVMEEFERGYHLGDKVLRHAKVVVSK